MKTAGQGVMYSDEKEIRALYARLLSSWEKGSEIYAQCFEPTSLYIVGNGILQHGWNEIVEGHDIIFSGWVRNSRLEGRIEHIKFLTGEVAVVVGYGHIVYKDHRSSDANKRTIYSLVVQKIDKRWLFVAYQNTPIGQQT